MKNIAIFGCPRTGKSTLAKMIAKKHPNYHIYIGDDIRETFNDVLPELDINSKEGIGTKEIFPKFLSTLFYRSIKRNDGDFNYILEVCGITPRNAKELFSNENTIILFLVATKLTKEAMFQTIRKYETKKDWTYYCNDEKLMGICGKFVKRNREIPKECEELNIWYVDTSIDRENILKKTLKIIESKIN